MQLEELGLARALMEDRTSVSRIQDDFSSWVVGALSGAKARFVASGPGCLDVIGGIAEYSGGLVLNVPLAEHACVGIQPRTDGILQVSVNLPGSGNGVAPFQVRLASLVESGPRESFNGQPQTMREKATACCTGTLVEALRAGLFAASSAGLSVAVASDLGEVAGVSPFAAISSALLVALAGMNQQILEPNAAAQVAQTAENDWVGGAVGPSASLCGLLGQANNVMQFRCDNRTLGGVLELPEQLRILSVACHGNQPDHMEKYIQARIAAFMGRLLVDRIVRHDGLLGDQWDGHLSRISVNDFVEKIRDRLPTRMSGREFLDRFGESGDPLTHIDPTTTYKVRSRTEHHVYEHARSRQFVEAMSRGIRTGDRNAYVEAGGFMNASHWSCGQRCGMGSVSANSLVNSLRKKGPENGIFGVRVAGRGCGGMLAVLVENTPDAEQTVADSLEAHIRDYNTPARILRGSLAGAMVSGVRRV